MKAKEASMKKYLAIILCAGLLCAVVSACGRAEPESVTTVATTTKIEETTEVEPTTEEPTTVFVPLSGEENGVSWRTLDLEDEDNSATCKWLEEWHTQWGFESKKEDGAETPLGKDKTVVRKGGYQTGQLILRNNVTGKETILLEDIYYGESDNPQQDEMLWKSPICLEAIDDRFFVFYWAGWSWACGTSIYDTKDMREIPIENDTGAMGNYFQTFGNHVYLSTPGDDGGYYGSLSLQRAVVTSNMGETLVAVELLKDYPNTDNIDVQFLGLCELSPDERYYIAHTEDGVLICDIKEKKPAWRIPFPAWDSMGAHEYWDPEALTFPNIAFRDTRTVYLFSGGQGFDYDSNVSVAYMNRYALEINLP